MPSSGNLEIYQGDDYTATVVVTGPDGVPPDQILNGFTAKAQIRNGPADSNPDPPVVTVQTTIQSPNIILSIPHTDTLKLGKAQYSWDLQLTDATGNITTIMAGVVKITNDITR